MDYVITFIKNGDSYTLVHEYEGHDPEITTLPGEEFDNWVERGRHYIIPNHYGGRNVNSRSDQRSRTNLFERSKNFGFDLHAAIFPEDHCSYNQFATKALEERETITIYLRLEDCPKLWEIPWELMYRRKDYLDIESTEIVRIPWKKGKKIHQSLKVDGTVRVLLTTAQPKETSQIKLGEEIEQIKRCFRSLSQKTTVELIKNVSRWTLQEQMTSAAFNGRPFHIWHHCGHGEKKDDKFCLVLNDGEKTDYVAPEEIGFNQLSDQKLLRLIVLNVCYGAKHKGPAHTFAGINAMAVLAFSTRVLDKHALQFSWHLFRDLPRRGLFSALKAARQTLSTASEPLAWAQPQLLTRFKGDDRIWIMQNP